MDPPAWRKASAFLRLRPSFLIIGAQRSGTTSLYRCLAGHPRILPALRKEIHYFDFQYAKGRAWYLAHFPIPTHPGANMTGEASPYYMAHPLAPRRVKRTNPAMKLIAVLRNPIDRAYSQYQQQRRLGTETLSFEDAVQAEPERLAVDRHLLAAPPDFFSFNHRHFSYLDRGRYGHYLTQWLEHFPGRQLLILDAEALFADANRTANAAFAFLGLAKHRLDQPTAFPKRDYEPLRGPMRDRLQQYYAADGKVLEALRPNTAGHFGVS